MCAVPVVTHGYPGSGEAHHIKNTIDVRQVSLSVKPPWNDSHHWLNSSICHTLEWNDSHITLSCQHQEWPAAAGPVILTMEQLKPLRGQCHADAGDHHDVCPVVLLHPFHLWTPVSQSPRSVGKCVYNILVTLWHLTSHL